MIVGFTGTRKGMTFAQEKMVNGYLIEWHPIRVRHGDCVGADHIFHCLAHTMTPRPAISIHPPDKDDLRAFCQIGFREGLAPPGERDEILLPLPYLVRNRAIVEGSDRIIACPAEMEEQSRGGTWSTVRLALVLLGVMRVTIILPDGTLWDLEDHLSDKKAGRNSKVPSGNVDQSEK